MPKRKQATRRVYWPKPGQPLRPPCGHETMTLDAPVADGISAPWSTQVETEVRVMIERWDRSYWHIFSVAHQYQAYIDGLDDCPVDSPLDILRILGMTVETQPYAYTLSNGARQTLATPTVD